MTARLRGGARRATAALVVTVAAVIGLAACGNTDVAPAWVVGHPDTPLLGFKTTAPGLCAITVRYADQAPAAIEYLGGVYVQVAQGAHATPAPGSKPIDHSGDWQVVRGSNGELVLLTPQAAYTYRLESTC